MYFQYVLSRVYPVFPERCDNVGQGDRKIMQPSTLLEVFDAAHLTRYVESPFPQRGGIMLVGPPGALKSTFIKASLEEYPSALVLSDLNVQQLVRMRDDIAGGRYTSIGFTEFEKLYQRHSSTAGNIEGHIKALVEEGFQRASFEDQRLSLTIQARSLIIGAMTYAFCNKRFGDWADSGFARRFLWCVIKLKNPEAIQDAIHEWKLIDLGEIKRKMPPLMNGKRGTTPGTRLIPYRISYEESMACRKMISDQHGEATPYVLLKKIFCVLKWKYNAQQAMKIVQDFSSSLQKGGGEVSL